MVFVDPYQGNNGVMLSLTHPITNRQYMEFIGGEKHRIHTCKAYNVKSNNGSRETGHTIKSRCACVWDIWWMYEGEYMVDI